MTTVAVIGSTNPEGRTAGAAESLLKGLESRGIDTARLILPVLKIERCRQCDENGWGICRREGRCVITDSFEAVAGRIRKADAVIFATPVYFSDLSECMKAFLDRLRRICMHEGGQTGIKGKPAVGICVAGGGGGGSPACAVQLEKVLFNCGFNVVDLIPVRRQNADLKSDVLKITGVWLADFLQNMIKP